ncbi:MAG: permease [Chloroflexi bacterium]|nr:permease [Chloroflexota bacterium]MCC6892917.1 permease [Anaerolineae bacterium]
MQVRSQSDADMRRLLWRGGLILAGLAVAIILALAVLGTGQSAGTIIEIFTTRFLGTFIEAVPFLLLGALVAGLIDSFLTADDIARVVPRNPILATITGAFLGFAFPVCECGVVPVVRRLFNKGLPMWVGITFLLAAPVINPIVLVSTYVAFGFGPVLIGRFVFTIIVAIGAGLVFALGARPQDVLQPRSLMPVMGGSSDMPPLHFVQRKTLAMGMGDAMRSATNEFFEMGRYLVLGCLLAAAMQTLVTQDVLLALGRGPIISVLVMQTMAFVLSVCSTVDSFLALSFLGTFTTGSIITFLTFGPMVDIKSTLMFMGVFRKRTVLYLILLPLLMTLLIGVWLNLNVVF